MSLFSYQSSLFVVSVFFRSNSDILSHVFLFVKNFFQVFLKQFFMSFNQLYYYINKFSICQELFSFLFNLKLFSKSKERRRRDLNPRTAQTVYTLSRGASSATWVLLQAVYFFWYKHHLSVTHDLLYLTNHCLSTTFYYFFHKNSGQSW